ncbi:hypothetical protein VNI00_002090 [Paramarasmius palmivorus]|uniref:Uncharacterized protein n=1 Tax=Paramarasmius palmivorus TaxID=297713 RepID=A0AAW0E544_9AGAR
MIFRRVLIRFLKLLIYIALIWISFGVLYLTLPSPVPNDDNVTASLQKGKTIARVFDVSTFFPYTDITPSVKEARYSGRRSFIMEFKYFRDSQRGHNVLAFGGGHDTLAEIWSVIDGPITNPWVPYYNLTLEDTEKQSLSKNEAWISAPITLPIPVGDTDGVSVPWIATADATMLYWWANHESANMTFRVRRVENGDMVEVWPDSFAWWEHQGGVLHVDKYPNTLKPLISIRLHGSSMPPSFNFPSLPDSSSPSILYPVRLSLLLFLLPVGAIGLLLFIALSGVFHGLMQLAVVLLNLVALGVVCAAGYGIWWWMRNERPALSMTLNDVREGVDTALANARARGAAAQEQAGDAVVFDVEAQHEAPIDPKAEVNSTLVKES